jgi:hypothetical protein
MDANLYVYFEFADGAYCCSDLSSHEDLVRLFNRGIALIVYEVRVRPN